MALVLCKIKLLFDFEMLIMAIKTYIVSMFSVLSHLKVYVMSYL